VKGPIFCSKDGEWKRELENRLKTFDTVTLMALGEVRYHVLGYLRHRQDIKIVRLETRYLKVREKGLGLKATVRSYKPILLKALATENHPKIKLEKPSPKSRNVEAASFHSRNNNTIKSKKKMQRL